MSESKISERIWRRWGGGETKENQMMKILMILLTKKISDGDDKDTAGSENGVDKAAT